MGMSVAGMGSGLDIEGMVTKLMAIERQPITKLDNQEMKAQSQISEWGKIKSALSAFQSTVQGLQSSSNFNAIKGTSSDSSVASITSGTASTLGSTSIEVTQLAKASKVMLGGLYASESTNVNSGSENNLCSLFYFLFQYRFSLVFSLVFVLFSFSLIQIFFTAYFCFCFTFNLL